MVHLPSSTIIVVAVMLSALQALGAPLVLLQHPSAVADNNHALSGNVLQPGVEVANKPAGTFTEHAAAPIGNQEGKIVGRDNGFDLGARELAKRDPGIGGFLKGAAKNVATRYVKGLYHNVFGYI